MGRGKRLKPPKEEENILKLPSEITLDILSRLPVRAVANCSSVCKAWRTILLDPRFPQIHLANAKAKSSVSLMLYCTSRKCYLLIEEFEKNLRKRKTMSKFSHSAQYVVGSCNGLLCLLSTVGPNIFHYVWSPVKNECITLPMPNIQIRNHHVGPYQYPTDICSGFGYCPRTNVYKVIITMGRMWPSWKPVCGVCTVGTNAWRTIEDDVPVPYCMDWIGNPNYYVSCWALKIPLNGAVHWFCRSKTGDTSFSLWICAFRIEDEKWDRILLPRSLLHQLLDIYPQLGRFELGVVLENCLAIFDGTEKSVLNIWLMKDYGVRESWTKCWRVDSQIPSELCVRSLVPLKLTTDGDLLVFDNVKNTLVCFNAGQRLTTRKERMCGTAELYAKGIAYVPSFISPAEIIKEGSGEEKLPP